MANSIAITGMGFITYHGYKEKEILSGLINNFSEDKTRSYSIPYSLKHKYKWINECANIGYNAAELAWLDCGSYSEINKKNWGVYVGTCLGGMTKTQKNICDAYLKYGAKGIMPSHSIHSGYHFTADIIAIEKQIFGPNITFTSGLAASGLLLLNAFDDIQHDNLDGIIAVGTEFSDELAVNLFSQLYSNKKIKFSSAACALILQKDSRNRGNGYIAAIEHKNFSNCSRNDDGFVHKQKLLIREALEKSCKKPSDIDLVVFTGPSTDEAKDNYRNVTDGLFKEEIFNNSIYLQDIFGNTLGTNCILGTGVGALCLKYSLMPYNNKIQNRKIKNALILDGDLESISTAVVVSGKLV